MFLFNFYRNIIGINYFPIPYPCLTLKYSNVDAKAGNLESDSSILQDGYLTELFCTPESTSLSINHR